MKKSITLWLILVLSLFLIPSASPTWNGSRTRQQNVGIPSVYASGITRIQNKTGVWSSGKGFTVTLHSTPTNGNDLLMYIKLRDKSGGGPTVTSIMQTGATWTFVGRNNNYIGNRTSDFELWQALNVTGAGTAITINLSESTLTSGVADAFEYSGLAILAPLDQLNTTSISSSPGTTTNTGTVTTTQANELWFGATVSTNTIQTTPINGFTLIDGKEATGGATLAVLEKIVTSTGTADSGTTLTASASWQGIMATFTTPTQTLTTSVASGSGSVGPNCPTGCPEEVGSSISITATPSAGYTFSSWTTVTGTLCSGGSSTSPCTFTMPSNAVTVSATFAPLTLVTTFSTTSSTLVSTTFTTNSTNTTSTVTGTDVTGSTTLSTTTNAPTVTGTTATTSTVTGPVAGTSTTMFTSILSTNTTTSVATSNVGQTITQTGVTTASTATSTTTTSSGTTLTTTTAGGTVTVTETDTFNVLLTNVYQELHQLADGFLQLIEFQPITTPIGQQVNQVVVTTTTTTTPTQVTMNVSYSVVGGGSPKAPVFHYVLKGVSKMLTLTKTARAVSVDAGSLWSVTPNPLSGSNSTQQWNSTQPLTGTTSATTIQFVFQHQYFLTMLVSGPGTVTPSSGWYNANQKVTIKATPNATHRFNSWTGTGTGSFTGTTASHTITMKAAITETATFT